MGNTAQRPSNTQHQEPTHIKSLQLKFQQMLKEVRNVSNADMDPPVPVVMLGELKEQLEGDAIRDEGKGGDGIQGDGIRGYVDLFITHISTQLRVTDSITEEEYVKIGSQLLLLSPGSSACVDYYWHILTGSKAHISCLDLEEMIRTAYLVALNCCSLDAAVMSEGEVKEAFKPVLDSIIASGSDVTRALLVTWSLRHCPTLLSGLHQWTVDRWCLLHTPLNPASRPLVDVLMSGRSLLTFPIVWLLSSILPLVYRNTSDTSTSVSSLADVFHWSLLYNSNHHGLSMNRFDHHVFGYQAPTVTIISFNENHIYALAIEEQWRESSQRWGGQNCVMLQLSPQYRFIQGGASMAFLNRTSRSVPKGFQFGKDSRLVMLEIDEEMSTVKHYGVEMKLERLETWGCGSAEVLEVQLKQKQWEHKEANKLRDRKLKLEDWKESPDRHLLEWGGVNVNHAQEYPNE